MARMSGRIATILSLIIMLSPSVVRAADAYTDMKKCIAGNAIDDSCMKKHRTEFEKYVITVKDHINLKRSVADGLGKYYSNIWEPVTEQRRQVQIKREAYAQLKAIYDQSLNAHYHNCDSCDDHLYLDISFDDLHREINIHYKQYLMTLDAALFAPEIKQVESDLKMKSDGTGFWSQAAAALEQGAANSTQH